MKKSYVSNHKLSSKLNNSVKSKHKLKNWIESEKKMIHLREANSTLKIK